MKSASDSTTRRARRQLASWLAAVRPATQMPLVCGLAGLTVLDTSGFRFKGPRGVPTPVFLIIVVVVIALIVFAIWRARRRRPAPPPDDWQRNRSTPGGRG